MQHPRRNNMSFLTQKTKPFLACIALLSLTTIASCSTDRKIDFEFTGQVLNKGTLEPYEGAYVIAVYEKVDLGFAGSARYCYKTKGMFTGKDGKFHFPIDKLDGNSPFIVHAIKPGYFLLDWALPSEALSKAQIKETYQNRHVYLQKQDPAKYNPGYPYGECSRPESREAAEANIQYLKLERDELIRIGSHFDWFQNSIDIIDRRIQRLQSVPDQK
jgi:hypothetical protein